jgi:hypothetical protein
LFFIGKYFCRIHKECKENNKEAAARWRSKLQLFSFF